MQGCHFLTTVVSDLHPVRDIKVFIFIGLLIRLSFFIAFVQEEEGWWEGSLNGKIGMFPSNFVEMIDSSEQCWYYFS